MNYLTQSLGFSTPKALSLCKRYPGLTTPEKPKSVVQFLKSFGFSDTHIHSTVNAAPQILCSKIDTTLKPKIQLFQNMGLADFDLGKFFSKNSTLLTRSIDKHLIPCFDILRKVFVNDKDLISVMNRSSWLFSRNPEKHLKVNVCYLMECGIVGSQLSMLLKLQPRLLAMKESHLRDLVRKVLDMGFSVDSRMFAYALQTISSVTDDTLARKFQLFQRFGFSLVDCREMFRRAPGLFRASEERLKFGLSFYLNTVKLEKISIVRRPVCLMHSMENKVIPRYRVLEILKSKRLLKKPPSIFNVLSLPEDVFLDKFISRFPSDAEGLLVVYKEHLLRSSEETKVK